LQVQSKGLVVASGSVFMTGNRTLVSFMISADMAPTSRFIVYYMRPDAEIVADSIIFEVDGLFKNKVIKRIVV